MASRDIAGEAAELMRRPGAAALATSLDGAPYVSLVVTAPDADGSPLLLISSLAQHTRNIAIDRRISILFDGTAGIEDRLAGARLTVLGSAAPCDDPQAIARYVDCHPAAAQTGEFSDFRLYRVNVDRGYFIAGFGAIQWIEAERLLSRSE